MSEKVKQCPKCKRVLNNKSWEVCPYDGTQLEFVEIPEGISFGAFRQQWNVTQRQVTARQNFIKRAERRIAVWKEEIRKLEKDSYNET